MTVFSSPCSAASPIMIWAKTPLSLHHFQRLYRVLCGPYSLGASRQRKPSRLMKIMPLRTRRSSTRGLPWGFGKKGSKRAICASSNQYRSLISPLDFRPMNHFAMRKSMGTDPRQTLRTSRPTYRWITSTFTKPRYTQVYKALAFVSPRYGRGIQRHSVIRRGTDHNAL